MSLPQTCYKDLKSKTPCSESLVEMSGRAGILIRELQVDEEKARVWIDDILSDLEAHTDHVEAVANALVNHMCLLWPSARQILLRRLDAEDKYLFMSMLMPLLMCDQTGNLDARLSALMPYIPKDRWALAEKLVSKIKQAGGKDPF